MGLKDLPKEQHERAVLHRAFVDRFGRGPRDDVELTLFTPLFQAEQKPKRGGA